MRVLVSTTAGSGHFGPLVPFASALQSAGHDVAVAAPASFWASVERAGFPFRPFADAPAQELREVYAGLQGVSFDEGNAIVIRDMFGRVAPRAALPGLRQIVADWQPHLILRETGELASYVVASVTGIPWVEVGVGLSAFDLQFAPVLEEPLAELGAKGGLVPLLSGPRLCLVPEILEVPSATGSHRTLRFRDDNGSETDEPLPDWWGSGASDPLVYVTFGSVAADLGLFPDFYQQVLAALADVPVRVLVTVGQGADPGCAGTAAGQRPRRAMVAPAARHGPGHGDGGPRWIRDDAIGPGGGRPHGGDAPVRGPALQRRSRGGDRGRHRARGWPCRDRRACGGPPACAR